MSSAKVTAHTAEAWVIYLLFNPCRLGLLSAASLLCFADASDQAWLCQHLIGALTSAFTILHNLHTLLIAK